MMKTNVFRVFRRLAFLVILTNVCVAFPVQTPLEVHPEAMVNGASMQREDHSDIDPWNSFHDIDSGDETNFPEDLTSTSEDPETISDKNVDPLSLVYYIGSFAALLLFFLVVSCSECCCERTPPNIARSMPEGALDDCPLPEAGTPPPPYDDFAPPAYNSLFENEESTKSKISVFVVPVHDTHRVPP